MSTVSTAATALLGRPSAEILTSSVLLAHRIEPQGEPPRELPLLLLRERVELRRVHIAEQALQTQLPEELPAGTTFKLLFDLHGYEPATIDAHKAMRAVIPLLLAETGMRPAVIDLFDDKPHVGVATAPNVRCVAFANLHHDPDKMSSYEEKIAKPDQRFFSDPDAAKAWLNEQPL